MEFRRKRGTRHTHIYVHAKFQSYGFKNAMGGQNIVLVFEKKLGAR